MAEKVEQPTEDQPPPKPAKKAKQPKQPKEPKQPKQDDGLYLPILVEFTYASSMIFLILVFLAMAAVSWLTGTSLLDFVLRTSAAMGVLGSLILVVARQVSAGVLSTSQEEIEAKRQELAFEQPDTQRIPEQPEKPVEIETSENVQIPAIAEAQ